MARHVAELFRRNGYHFETIDYRQKSVNPNTIRKYLKGDILGLVQVDMASKGFDAPDTRCMIDIKPIRKSFSRYVQFLGRGIRIAEGKSKALLLDHTDNYAAWRLPLVQYYSRGVDRLDDGRWERLKGDPNDRAVQDFTCRECGYVAPAGEKVGPCCPACGQERVSYKPDVDVVPGKFVYAGALDGDLVVSHDIWPDICQLADHRYRDKFLALRWSRAIYRSLAGRWPVSRDFEPSGKRVSNEVRTAVPA